MSQTVSESVSERVTKRVATCLKKSNRTRTKNIAKKLNENKWMLNLKERLAIVTKADKLNLLCVN